ncbi:putative mitochondrial protein [Andalucia godoyi]|uniref:Putative mitochondrial protein n=1 Tax=Andalucia godoyi TaxID=505711 RepID=A0A8K0AH39_ANDGO|nr:putative mitochondrial protein [Andalucia godoyi]|eukprot:ANDGO_01015.mRNA.1 putative mitochondrial protein
MNGGLRSPNSSERKKNPVLRLQFTPVQKAPKAQASIGPSAIRRAESSKFPATKTVRSATESENNDEAASSVFSLTRWKKEGRRARKGGGKKKEATRMVSPRPPLSARSNANSARCSTARSSVSHRSQQEILQFLKPVTVEPDDFVQFDLDLELHSMLPDSLTGKLCYVKSQESRNLLYGSETNTGPHRDTFAHVEDMASQAISDTAEHMKKYAVERLMKEYDYPAPDSHRSQQRSLPTLGSREVVVARERPKEMDHMDEPRSSISRKAMISRGSTSPSLLEPTPGNHSHVPLMRPLDFTKLRKQSVHSEDDRVKAAASSANPASHVSSTSPLSYTATTAKLRFSRKCVLDAIVAENADRLVDPASVLKIASKRTALADQRILTSHYRSVVASRLPERIFQKIDDALFIPKEKLDDGGCLPPASSRPRQSARATSAVSYRSIGGLTSSRSSLTSARGPRKPDNVEEWKIASENKRLFCGRVVEVDKKKGLGLVEIWSVGDRFAVDFRPKIWVPIEDLRNRKLDPVYFERHVKQPYLKAFAEFRVIQEMDERQEEIIIRGRIPLQSARIPIEQRIGHLCKKQWLP